jgi:hypothetical protein
MLLRFTNALLFHNQFSSMEEAISAMRSWLIVVEGA